MSFVESRWTGMCDTNDCSFQVSLQVHSLDLTSEATVHVCSTVSGTNARVEYLELDFFFSEIDKAREVQGTPDSCMWIMQH